MDEDVTPERLFVMLNEEKKTGELLPLSKNFYGTVFRWADNHHDGEGAIKDA